MDKQQLHQININLNNVLEQLVKDFDNNIINKEDFILKANALKAFAICGMINDANIWGQVRDIINCGGSIEDFILSIK